MSNTASTLPAPQVITWRRNGYEIILDGYGVNLRVPSSRTFDPHAIAEVVDLYDTITAHVAAGGTFAVPDAPDLPF